MPITDLVKEHFKRHAVSYDYILMTDFTEEELQQIALGPQVAFQLREAGVADRGYVLDYQDHLENDRKRQAKS